MKEAFQIIGASAVGFVLTTLYLLHEKPHGDAGSVPAQQQAREAGTNERGLPPAPSYQTARAPGLQATASRSAQRSPLAPPLPQHAGGASLSASGLPLIEQRQLEEYFGGVSAIEPVNAQQREALLQSKLRHEKSFSAALKDSGLARESLSTAERAYAHSMAGRALYEYRSNFLMDARAVLSEEQYSMLEAFEDTEFKRRLANLQAQINAK